MVATAKGADVAAWRDDSRREFLGFVQEGRRAGKIRAGQAAILRIGTALKWNRPSPSDESVSYGEAAIAICEEAAMSAGIVCGPREGRDWKAFFEALMPFIEMLLELIMSLFMGL